MLTHGYCSAGQQAHGDAVHVLPVGTGPRTGHVVYFQKAQGLPTLHANATASGEHQNALYSPAGPAGVYDRPERMLTLFVKACTAEQDEVDEGPEDAGEYQLLAGHIYGPFGSVLPLSDTVRFWLALGENVNSSVNLWPHRVDPEW